MAPRPEEGDPAPDFILPAEDGSLISLAKLKGNRVVLYFYPKDDTPGCTKEACAFRDAAPDFGVLDAVILGVSKDDEKSHRKFKRKYELPFTLLSDLDGKVCDAYGVWKEKSLYGRSFLGIERTTFLIDERGRIAKVWPKVHVEGHADQVLAALAE